MPRPSVVLDTNVIVSVGNKKHFPTQWQQTKIVNTRELLQEITADLQR